MTKKELAKVIADSTGNSAKVVADMIDVIFGTIFDTAASGEKVSIAKFLNVEVKTRAARTCRVPATGETVEVPAKKYYAVSVPKSVSSALND